MLLKTMTSNPSSMYFNESNETTYYDVRRLGNETYAQNPMESNYMTIVNGYVVPSLAMFVLLINGVVIVVLKRQKTYGASQAGLVSVAVSDTLTLILPAPFYFALFGLNKFPSSCGWLECMDYIALYLPTISHTASIWLTVLLTVQRYIYVCKPFHARTWCTLRNTTIAIVITYALAFCVHLCRFFLFEYTYITYYELGLNYTQCSRVYRPWINVSTYMSLYMIIRIVFIQFVPCVCLVIFNCKILHGLRNVTKKRLALHNNAESNLATVKENNRVTVMIICMAAITLLVEFPGGIIQMFYVFPYMFTTTVLEAKALQFVETIINLIIMFTYPLNFLLYCSMSAEFKATLKELCLGTCQLAKCFGNGTSRNGLIKVPSSAPIYLDKATNCSTKM